MGLYNLFHGRWQEGEAAQAHRRLCHFLVAAHQKDLGAGKGFAAFIIGHKDLVSLGVRTGGNGKGVFLVLRLAIEFAALRPYAITAVPQGRKGKSQGVIGVETVDFVDGVPRCNNVFILIQRHLRAREVPKEHLYAVLPGRYLKVLIREPVNKGLNGGASA